MTKLFATAWLLEKTFEDKRESFRILGGHKYAI
jgi:hypothetical protein